MKKLLSILSLTALLLAGCAGQYDDTALKEKIDALSSQVAKCIQQVNDLNTQVQGLNAVIEQWKKGGFVESVQEVDEGVTITFVGGKTVTLKVMAESFSDIGVPVFLADVKGDLSGMTCPGAAGGSAEERVVKM